MNGELKKEIAEKLKETGAVRFGDFVLSSGKRSSIYIDIKHACTHPDILAMIAKGMKELADSEALDFQRIACVELGGVPIAVALSLETGKPYAIFRKQKKDYGVKDDLVGVIEKGDKILVVEDVTTTGSSALSAVERVRARGGEVEAVLVVVDREEGAAEAFREKGVRLIPLLSLGDLR
ncbi:orotate phosphoribosyltransferase [Archaeoglobus veneficus]|uniref:Orotate phosphoribosyltransferase n=1 Tax=Archaeoglobus veneficus (strain DSM 11195 / SNP6) TaxID=693661 RepID=F2KR69_ARCVS|nr:orotate phosphoribosyltransferase [Archaeoglobus veneficus]AEA46706.1 orotate phosphoribosyltransferase [Archaeoglobus veneficus SNP6]